MSTHPKTQMKQTNNAIKFLMAQYRAIFKHAYLKGIVSAVALTAGLAANVANAVPNSFNPSSDTFSGNVVFTATDKFTMDGTEYNLTAGQGLTVTAPGPGESDYTLNFSKNGSTFKFNNAAFNIATDNHAGFGARVTFGEGKYEMVGDNYVSQMLTLDAGNIAGDDDKIIKLTGNGNLHVTGYLTVSMGAGDNKVDLSGAKVFIKSGKVGATQETTDGGLIIDPSITVGDLTFEGNSNINLYYDKYNWELATNAETIDDRKFKEEKTINIAEGSTVKFAEGTHKISSSADLDADTRFSLVFAKSGSTPTTAANVLVDKNASLQLSRNVTIADGVAFANNGTLTIDSGSVLTISGSSSGSSLKINAGSTFNNEGTLVISGTKATLANAEFDVSVTKSIDDLGEFKNSGSITLTTTNSSGASFSIDGQEDLSKLLNENQQTANDFKGALVLNKVTLESNNDLELAQAEMTKFSGSANGTIHADKITFTVGEDNGDDLHGVKVFGDTLVFSDDDASANGVLVSGSGTGAVFAGYTITTDDNQKITLGNNVTLEMVNQGTAAANGSIDVALELSGSAATTPKLTITDLSVTAKDITLTTSGNLTVTGDKFATALNLNGTLDVKDANSSVTVKNAALSAKVVNAGAGSISITDGGSLTTTTIDCGTGSINLTGSSLTINADSKSGSNITNGNKITVTNGTLNLTDVSDTVGLTYSDDNWGVASDYNNKIKVNGSTVVADLSNVLSSGQSLTVDAANKLLGTLASGTGLIDIGETQVTIDQDDITENTTTGKTEVDVKGVDDGNGNVVIKFENDQTKDLVLNGVQDGKTVTGGWEGVKTAGTGTAVNVVATGQLELHGTAQGDNIIADSKGNVVDLNLGNNSVAKINSVGNIGEVRGSGSFVFAAGSDVTVVNKNNTTQTADVAVTTIEGAGKLTADDITATNANLNSGSVVSASSYKSNSSGTFTATGANVTLTKTMDLANVAEATIESSVVKAKDFKFADAVLTESAVSGETLTGSNITASASELDLTKLDVDSLNLTDNALVKADVVEINNGGLLTVGSDGEKASNATLQVERLDLNDGILIADPNYDQAASLVITNTVGKAGSKIPGGELNGQVVAAQNSIVALGVDDATSDLSKAELTETFSSLLNANGSLSKDDIGAILYVGKAIEVTEGSKLIADAHTTGTDAKTALIPSSTKYAADGYIGKNSAFAIDENALNANGTNGAVHFNKADAKIQVESGAKVLLVGDGFNTRDNIVLFTDKGTTTSDTNGVKIEGKDLRVETLNGLFYFTYKAGYETTAQSLNLNHENIKYLFNDASAPVKNTLIAYAARDNNWAQEGNTDYKADKLHGELVTNITTTDGENFVKKGTTETVDAKKYVAIKGEDDKYVVYEAAYNDFLDAVVRDSYSGKPAEQAARMSIFGGTAQAALTAGATTYDAISGRMGVGAQYGSITFADNGQGAGLWVTPVYKNQDSDGFGSQGLTYGADLDMYGVALGGDFTMANGLRVGAAFNVGSGDADGNGAAAGVSNDFDYYGFAVYGGFSMDKFSVVADVSYTVVDNDVEANNNIDKLTASMDSSNLSVGVTGQYAFDYGTVSITPHAGLRYTYIDMDDYNIKGVDSGDVAHFAGDSFSVFSIPVGVTFAKEIVSGDWTVKPAFDLTLTANMGDDSAEGTVNWAGIDNLQTRVESEVIDSFTYGATLGVSAKSGNLSLGFGVNYTGASSADEYGVSANARFVF